MDESWFFPSSEQQQSRGLQMSNNMSYVNSALIEKSFGVQVSSVIEGQPIESIQVCNGIYKVMIEDMKVFDQYMYTSLPTSPNQQPPLKETYLAELLCKTKAKAKYTFDLPKYNNCIGQAIMIMKQKMQSHWQRISSSLPNYYSDLYQRNNQFITASRHELKHSEEDNTPKRLFILDIFSLVLKHNRILRELCRTQQLKGTINKQTIKAIFGIQDLQYYEGKLGRSQDWLKFEQIADYQHILMLLSIAELRYRIHNFKTRTKGAKIILDKPINLPFKNAKEYFNYFRVMQDEKSDDFKFKFSEIVCFGQGDPFSYKAALIQAQIIDQLTKIANQDNFTQRKSMFLGVKLKYRVSPNSLYDEYVNLKKAKENSAYKIHQREEKMKFDLNNAEWIHLLDNKFPKTLETIIVRSQFMYKNKFFATLFEKSENRFKLLQRVVQAQIELEKKVGRRIIYVSRLEYSYDQLVYSKSRSNSKTASSLTQETGIKFYIIIGTDSERVLFTSISYQALEDSDYNVILKKYFATEGIKHATLVLSQISYQKMVYWHKYLRLCSYFKEHYDTHVYVDNSIKLFAPHQKLYSIIKAYLLDYSYLNPRCFHGQVEKYTHEIVLLLGSKIIESSHENSRRIQKSTDLDEKTMMSNSEIEHIGKVLLQIFAGEMSQVKYELLSNRQKRVIKFYKYSKEDILNKLTEYASSKRQVTSQNASLKECLAKLASENLKRNYSKANLINETDQNVIIAKVLEKRGMKIRMIKYILKNVTKILLLYEIFFKMLRQEAEKLKTQQEQSYLQEVYHQEEIHIIQIFTEKAKVLRRVMAVPQLLLCKDLLSFIEHQKSQEWPTNRKVITHEVIKYN